MVGKYCTMPVIYLAKMVEFQNENPCLYFAQFELESGPQCLKIVQIVAIKFFNFLTFFVLLK